MENSSQEKILIVDDNPENIHLLMEHLESRYSVFFATSGEKVKIQQVFFNILKNGAETMMETGMDDPCFILSVSLKEAHGVVAIEDNGPGMDDGVRKRIFEPFFTTKKIGVGTVGSLSPLGTQAGFSAGSSSFGNVLFFMVFASPVFGGSHCFRVEESC